MENNSQDMSYCNICPKSYEQKHQLKMHMYTHDDKPFSCSNCSIKFSTLKGSLEHAENKVCQKLIPCDICSKDFKSSSSLKSHNKFIQGLSCKNVMFVVKFLYHRRV